MEPQRKHTCSGVRGQGPLHCTARRRRGTGKERLSCCGQRFARAFVPIMLPLYVLLDL
jgi:hypothetical protein